MHFIWNAATRHTRASALVAALQNVIWFFLLALLQGFSEEEPILFFAGSVEPIRVHRHRRWV